MYALEPAMQKQLIKCQPNGTPLQPLGHSRISMPMPPRLRVSGIPPERSRLSAPALPLQMGAISRTPHSPSSIHSTMARSTGKRTPLSRQNSSTCVSFVEMSPIRKRSFAETFSQETSSLPKKHTKHINPLLPRTRVPSSSSSPVDTTAAPSILHMLQSDTVEINCKALHTLAEKLKDSQQDPLGVSLLPPGVPSRIDLLPLLVSYITQGKKEIQFYKILMDWESLTSIFIHVFSLNHYVPSLIKAEQAQIHTSDMSPHELLVREIYAKGLKRLKIILKRTDPLLTPKLLTLVQEKLDDSRRREMISRVNKDHDLIRGLLEWIDELVCDYVGLGDEDPVLLEEGRCWIKSEDGTTIQALEWFENATNIVFCLNTFLPLLQRISSEPMVYEPLMPLIGHLRLCNQRVFEKVSQEHGRAIADILQKAFYTHPSTPPMLQDSLASPPYQASLLPLAMDQEQSNLSMSKLLEECSSGPAGYTLENLDESTGMTYDISKIAIDFKKYHSQDRQSLGAMRYELEWPDLPELDKEEEMTGIADILDLPMSPSGSNHSRLWTNNDRVAEERREDTFMSLPFETHMHSPSESQSQLYSPLPQSPSPLESHSTLPLPLSSQSQPPLESQSQSQIYSQPHSQQHSHSKSYSKSHSQPHSQPHSPLESHSPLPLPLSSESYPMSSFSPSHSHLHSPTDPTELQRTKYLDTNFPLTQNDRLLFLKTSVYRIQQQEALTPILFTHLQRLSRETAFDKTHYDTTTQVWKYLHHHGMDIESLVNGLIVCFKDTSRLDRDVETEVILLIKSLLVHQSVLFQHYNQTDPTESMETHLMYRLMEVLIHSKVTILQYGLDRSDTLSAANDALDTLLSLIHPSIVSNILWSLLDKHIQCDKDTSPSPVQTCTLSTLFSYLGQLAPRIPAQCLEESLQKNAATLLLQVNR
ncbi:hypothetical protein BDF14DRAFT_1863429 [Spinellus fusiger]|nr:hypothetical protein BDF14DRAFT_1863429 [Spinellus fusiger]